MRPFVYVLALLLAGCASTAEKSNLADDVLVTVKGTVHDAAGNGVGAAQATLATNNPFDFGAITDVTAGVNLKGPGVRTNANGAFTMTLRGGQTKNSYAQAQDFNLVVKASDAPNAPFINRAVRFTTQDVTLVDFKLFDALRSPAEGDTYPAGKITLGLTRPPDEKPDHYVLAVYFKDGNDALYNPIAQDEKATLPDYLFNGGETYDWKATAYMQYETRFSGVHRFTTPAGGSNRLVPIKEVRDVDGKAQPLLTDAVLTSGITLGDTLIVDLGTPQTVASVVLIGAAGGNYMIQTSGDAGDFTAPTPANVSSGGGGWLELSPAQPVQARYVKLTRKLEVSPSPSASTSPSPSASPGTFLREVRVLKP
ncbi:MAG: hypothetical protein JWM80_6195 [Cyanobacteria bacterium RYN_339]|nr:hypothetical protein [Cyanobacteria bacterium RYN_339]